MPTPDELRRYQADVVTWAEECVWLISPDTRELGPLVLADHQKEFLRAATARGPDGRFIHRTAVACWPRREGKTTMVAVLLAWRMCCFRNQRLLILANSEKQAQSNLYELLTGILRDSPRLLELVEANDAIQNSRVEVRLLDNVCECLPNNYRTVQGRPRTDALAVDEIHAAQSTKAFDFATNQLEAADAQCLISSQAGAPVQSNPVWRLHQARAEEHIHFSYMQAHVMPWAQALAERERAVLLPAEWEYQHRNCWGSVGLKLLSPEAVEAACRPFKMPETRGEWENLKKLWRWGPCAIGVGLDRAGVSIKGDRTVWTVTACHVPPGGEAVFAVPLVITLYTGSEAEVLEAHRRTQAIFGYCRQIIFEQYGCSDIVEKVPGAQLRAPTSQAQQTLFTRLHRLFEERRIWFPENAGRDHLKQQDGLLKEELITFAYDAERAGLTRFGTQGGHDDHPFSLAWAIEAADAGAVTSGGGPAHMIRT